MTDRIEKTIDLNAPVDRVWRALTDHAEFGQWFGVKLEAPFQAGRSAHGHITNKGYEHVVMEIVVQAIEPKTLFSYTWHPYAVDPAVDYSDETPTLVEFHLSPTAEGSRLVVIETGFDALPEHRKADCLRMNDRGWATQIQNIKAHVEA
jgi:uncharacterized protein YndB with AHSA1/START domain